MGGFTGFKTATTEERRGCGDGYLHVVALPRTLWSGADAAPNSTGMVTAVAGMTLSTRLGERCIPALTCSPTSRTSGWSTCPTPSIAWSRR